MMEACQVVGWPFSVCTLTANSTPSALERGSLVVERREKCGRYHIAGTLRRP